MSAYNNTIIVIPSNLMDGVKAKIKVEEVLVCWHGEKHFIVN
jgi:hypothetical protein